MRSGPLTVWFLPDPAGDRPRLAFAIGRRVGEAVVRNRLRRQLRHAAADIARRQPGALPPGAYLVRVDPTVTSSSYQDLAACLSTALAHIARRVT